jgi:hypothetical protein
VRTTTALALVLTISLAIALRYWFNGVMFLIGAATACFTIAAVLSA